LIIPIVFFSSSGNTRYIAQLISNGLKFAKFDTELIPFNSLEKKELNFNEINVIGIGAPIYAMSFTLNIIDWVKKIPRTHKKIKFFLFDTNAGIPGYAIKNMRKLLEQKKFEFIGALEVTVPTRDSVFEMSFFKYVNWSRKNIERSFQFGIKLSKIIRMGEGTLNWSLKSMPFAKIYSAYFKVLERPLYKVFSHFFGFYTTKCISCRTCEKECPVKAITFNIQPIINPNKCIFCFRCTRNCPSNALYFKLFPKAIYFKGPENIRGYISPDELLEEYKKKIIF
jgi:ferredoxin/flavodoxin